MRDESENMLKNDLPNFPQELIVDWLEPFVGRLGWPPSNVRWEGVLLSENLEFWRGVAWKKERLDLTRLQLSAECQHINQSLLEAYIHERQNIYAHELGQSGKERFLNAARYLFEHGKFPKPIILLKRKGDFDVADGNHRFLAWTIASQIHRELSAAEAAKKEGFLLSLRNKWGIQEIAELATTQEVWIGENLEK